MRRFVAATITTALIVSACSSSGNSPAASSAASSGASTGASAAASAATSPSASSESSAGASGSAGASASAGAEASSSAGASGGTGASGEAILSGWQSSPAEGNALTQTLLSFQSAHPKVKVNYQPLGGDYAAGMAAKFASGDVPDVFYVDAGYAKQWIDQGFLAPLDDYIAKSGFDTSQFFPGYASIFKGTDGKTYGLPKDGNTIAMAYNTDLVPTPPKTMDELVTVAQGAEGQERPQGAAVPEPRARPRARVHLRPGRLAPVRRRQDRARSTLRRVQGGGPVVHGPLQERSRHERGRHRRRLVRRRRSARSTPPSPSRAAGSTRP